MDIYDTIYIIYEIVSSYLIDKKLDLDQDLWLETMLISFIEKNLEIDLDIIIIYLCRDLDTLLYKKIKGDVFEPQKEILDKRFKFRIRNLSRKILLRLKKLKIKTNEKNI